MEHFPVRLFLTGEADGAAELDNVIGLQGGLRGDDGRQDKRF